MVYRLRISYRGTHYAGWQRQPNALAVQQVIEEALSSLVGEPLAVVGASRTDAGVHARGQAAHLRLARQFPSRGLVHGGNTRLPEDIRILAAERMADDFHARHSAAAKEYRFRLVRTPVLTPLESLFAVRVDPAIDLAAMRGAAAALVGRHDFSAFALAGGSHRSPVRRLLEAEWLDEGDSLALRLVGDGFLRGMVRSIAGTLLEVGRGRRAESEIADLLTGRPRSEAGPTAPARGLTLERVIYRPPGGR